jgi:hypothetical protein
VDNSYIGAKNITKEIAEIESDDSIRHYPQWIPSISDPENPILMFSLNIISTFRNVSPRTSVWILYLLHPGYMPRSSQHHAVRYPDSNIVVDPYKLQVIYFTRLVFKELQFKVLLLTWKLHF